MGLLHDDLTYRMYVYIDGDIVVCKPETVMLDYRGDKLFEVRATALGISGYPGTTINYRALVNEHGEADMKYVYFEDDPFTCYRYDRGMYCWLGEDENQTERFGYLLNERLKQNMIHMTSDLMKLSKCLQHPGSDSDPKSMVNYFEKK